MIATHWFRRFILALFFIEFFYGLQWVSTQLAHTKAEDQLFQNGIVFIYLFFFYAAAPFYARFLAPHATEKAILIHKIEDATRSLPIQVPYFVYDNHDKDASTLGLFQSHLKIFFTSSMLEHLSESGLRGILAHEATHATERHIVWIFTFACFFVLGNQLLKSPIFFILGFLGFMALRRYLEFRADEGAARLAGIDAIYNGLCELENLAPSKSWHRYVVFLSTYPTIPMRVEALKNKKIAWL